MLQSSGAISLSDIRAEFGGPTPIVLSNYYRNTSSNCYTTANNTSVPNTLYTTISLSDFYGASLQSVSFVGGKAVAYVGGGTTQTLTISGLTGGTGASPIAGDFVALSWGVSTGSATNTTFDVVTAGWTKLYNLFGSSTTGIIQSTQLMFAYKFWTSSDTSVTFNVSTDINNAACAILHVYRYVNQTDPFLSINSWIGVNNSSTLISPPSVSVTRLGAAICVIGGFGNDQSSALTLPASLTNTFSVNSDDYRDFRLAVGKVSAAQAENTTYTPGTWTMATSTNRCPAAITFALKPA